MSNLSSKTSIVDQWHLYILEIYFRAFKKIIIYKFSNNPPSQIQDVSEKNIHFIGSNASKLVLSRIFKLHFKF